MTSKKIDLSELSYQEKKQLFSNMLTIYGRKSVLEALQANLDVFRIHLASSNQKAPILQQICDLAKQQHIDVMMHDKKSLSRISKNARQDQGIAADIICPRYQTFDNWLHSIKQPSSKDNQYRLLALDAVQNPQNLGMIIRSASAAGITGILIAPTNTAKLGPLVIKASAGTIFKAPLIFCDNLQQSLLQLQQQHCELAVLASCATHSVIDYRPKQHCCYILGNETHGVSDELFKLSDMQLYIPMHNQVESLNVAATATLISYLPHFQTR